MRSPLAFLGLAGAAAHATTHTTILATVLATVLATALAPAQDEPGRTSWGTADYVEYTAGTLPVVLSSGHGGALRPSDVRDRTYGVRTQDAETQPLTRELAAELMRLTGRRPHVVLSHLHRVKLDPNREIVEAAQGDPQAERAWREYHGFVEQAKTKVVEHHGRGLYVDVHGHGHPEPWIEWGYALSASDLANPDSVLDTPRFIDRSTIRDLARRPGIVFSAVLRGPSSFGGLMQQSGYEGVPSPQHPDPGGGNYFRGGYSVQRHGSRDGGTVDAVQIELPSGLRRDVPARRAMVPELARSIATYLRSHYGIDPAAEPRLTVVANRPLAHETGSPGSFTFARAAGDTSAPVVVPFRVRGSAQAGSDYLALPGQVTIPAGRDRVTLAVDAFPDARDEGFETVAVALLGGVEVGWPSHATVVIVDDGDDPDLLARWTMDEVVAGRVPDVSSGGLHPATLRPDVVRGPQLVPGRHDGALAFDERDDHLEVSDFDYAPAGAFTLAFWFRAPASTQQGYQYVVGHDAFGVASSLNVYFVEATSELRSNLRYANDHTPTEHLDVFENFMDGAWHHYAMIASSRGLSRVSIDGVERAVGAFSGDSYDPSGPLRLAIRSDLSPSRFFGGDLDEVRIWGRALDPAEVAVVARERPGRAVRYGSGCAGSRGTPEIRAGAFPQVGRNVRYTLHRGPDSRPVLLALGLSRDSWNGSDLPLDLGGIGAPGCAVWVAILDTLAATSDATGSAAVAVPVPADPGLIGGHLFAQFACVDPPANALGLTVTPGLDVALGGVP